MSIGVARGSASPARVVANRVPALRLLAGGALAVFAVIQVQGLSNSILGYHAFRQTQTAWTIRQFLRGGPLLRYETPIGGPPWAIPMELPVYQWICAAASWILRTPLEPTARAVSALFGLGCIGMAVRVVRSLGRGRSDQMITAAVLACSPALMFWSHAILIETCAVFFALWWFERSFQWLLWRRSVMNGLASAVLGAIAASVKIIALARAVMFFGVLVLWKAATAPGRSRAESGRTRRLLNFGRALIIPAVLVAVPLGVGSVWTSYTDGVKSKNLVGAGWMSSASGWMFGTAEGRRSFIGSVVSRALVRSIGLVGTLVIVGAFLATAIAMATRRRRTFDRHSGFHQGAGEISRVPGLPLVGTGGFIVAVALPLILFRLFYLHDYYIVEIAPYLALALMAAFAGLRARSSRAFVAILCLTLFASLSEYAVGYLAWEKLNPVYPAELLVEVAKTDPTDIVVIGDLEISVGWAVDRPSMAVWEFKTPGALSKEVRRVEGEGFRVGTVLTRPIPGAVRRELQQLGFVSVGRWHYEVWTRPATTADGAASR